jgi:hypothetical protein
MPPRQSRGNTHFGLVAPHPDQVQSGSTVPEFWFASSGHPQSRAKMADPTQDVVDQFSVNPLDPNSPNFAINFPDQFIGQVFFTDPNLNSGFNFTISVRRRGVHHFILVTRLWRGVVVARGAISSGAADRRARKRIGKLSKSAHLHPHL